MVRAAREPGGARGTSSAPSGRPTTSDQRTEPRAAAPYDGGRDGCDEAGLARPLKRPRAREHLVQHGAESEDAGAGIGLAPLELLGGHVLEGAHHGPLGRERLSLCRKGREAAVSRGGSRERRMDGRLAEGGPRSRPSPRARPRHAEAEGETLKADATRAAVIVAFTRNTPVLIMDDFFSCRAFLARL